MISNEIDEIAPGLDFVRMTRHHDSWTNRRTIGGGEGPHEEQNTTSYQNTQNVKKNDHNTLLTKAINFFINSTK